MCYAAKHIAITHREEKSDSKVSVFLQQQNFFLFFFLLATAELSKCTFVARMEIENRRFFAAEPIQPQILAFQAAARGLRGTITELRDISHV